MTRAPEEDTDLKLVSEMFAERGLHVTGFSKQEVRVGGRTPDWNVMRGNDLVAYCEVKSPRDEWLEDSLDRATPGEIVGGRRSDPIFNRLSNIVRKAASRFDAVNQKRSVPNILVFVNHDDMSGFHDLRETLTGFFWAADGSRHPTMLQISEGRIRESKNRIDLYVWVDGSTGQIHGYLLSEAIPEHVDNLCDLLGLNKAKIVR